MKFENIKVGMKIEQKTNGMVYTVVYVDEKMAEVDVPYRITEFGSNTYFIFKSSKEHKLFRKYKEQK